MANIIEKIKRGLGLATEAELPRVSTYQYLLNKGYTDEQIRSVAVGPRDLSTRTWGISVGDAESDTLGFDGKPLVGIVYRCDYKAEEEAGGGKLRKVFGVPRLEAQMDKSARGKNLVRQFMSGGGIEAGEVALGVGVESLSPLNWGEDVTAEPARAGGWASTLSYRDYDSEWESYKRIGGRDLKGQRKWIALERHTVAELNAIAEAEGVEKKASSERKAAFVARLERLRTQDVKVFPGWFQSGKVLILRAGGGPDGTLAERIAQDVLWRLRYAYEAGTLGFGSALSGPFSTGLSLFDAHDLRAETVAAWRAHKRWVEEQERLLEPVAEELRKRGHKWFALGNPSSGFKSLVGKGNVDENTVFYWLNGESYPLVGGSRRYAQPYGWYTLEELLAEKFVTDLEEKESKNSGEGAEVRVTGKPRSGW